MPDYKRIFAIIENTLKDISSLSRELFDERFGHFKNLDYRNMTDQEIFWTLVCVVFYSGMRAATVSERLPAMKRYLVDYEKVREFSGMEVNRIMGDEGVIHHRKKIEACITNAKQFQELLARYGSFAGYLQFFGNPSSERAINGLREDLKKRFEYLGERTVNHFLTDLGFYVLKPDRVICRIFERLGLIESRNDILEAIEVGKKFSSVTGFPIRYIDIIFVKYGQMGRDDYFGLKDGICLEKNPKCKICGVTEYCRYYETAH